MHPHNKRLGLTHEAIKHCRDTDSPYAPVHRQLNQKASQSRSSRRSPAAPKDDDLARFDRWYARLYRDADDCLIQQDRWYAGVCFKAEAALAGPDPPYVGLCGKLDDALAQAERWYADFVARVRERVGRFDPGLAASCKNSSSDARIHQQCSDFKQTDDDGRQALSEQNHVTLFQAVNDKLAQLCLRCSQCRQGIETELTQWRQRFLKKRDESDDQLSQYNRRFPEMHQAADDRPDQRVSKYDVLLNDAEDLFDQIADRHAMASEARAQKYAMDCIRAIFDCDLPRPPTGKYRLRDTAERKPETGQYEGVEEEQVAVLVVDPAEC